MAQANVSRRKAILALRHNDDIMNAIMKDGMEKCQENLEGTEMGLELTQKDLDFTKKVLLAEEEDVASTVESSGEKPHGTATKCNCWQRCQNKSCGCRKRGQTCSDGCSCTAARCLNRSVPFFCTCRGRCSTKKCCCKKKNILCSEDCRCQAARCLNHTWKSQVLCCETGLEMAGSIPVPERRIVLVGGWRNGKSATGNTILGSKFFESEISWKSVRQTCQKKEALLKGRKVVVVDTPGFFHTDHSDEDIAAEVSKCMKFCSPGPHVILHVISPFRCSQGMEVAQRIKEIFGVKAKDYTITLFTHKDGLKCQYLENVISSRDKNLKEYIAERGNRFLAFNNKAEGEEREAQVAELMTMIDDLVEMNRDAPCYTEDMMNIN